MNFLTEILTNAEKVQIEDINKKLPEVSLKIDNFKSQVTKYLDGVYVSFSERPLKNKRLLNEANDLQNEINELSQNVLQVNITDTRNTLNNTVAALEKVEVSLKLVSQLINVHEGFLEIKDMVEKNYNSDAASKLILIQDEIAGLAKEKEFTVVPELQMKVLSIQQTILVKVANIFADNVIVDIPEKNDCYCTFKVKERNNDMCSAVSALALLQVRIRPLDKIVAFLRNHVFTPIIMSVASVQVIKERDFVCLKIIVVNNSKKSVYKNVFKNIQIVSEYLQDNLSYTLRDDLTCMSYIGKDLREYLVDILIKECLTDTIPSSKEGLEQYSVVIQDTEEFQEQLIKYQLFEEATISLLEYANNVDVLFINKRCHEYTSKALAIMKKDLHNFKEVGKLQGMENKEEDLPLCCVSTNVIELLEFAENILQQATTNTDICSGRLICTVQNIFYQYDSVVTQHHQKLLQTIPQQVALFYNNCMHISQELTKWNRAYQGKLPPNINIGTPFKDQPHNLSSMGKKIFNEFVQNQIKQIEDIVNESGLSRLRSSDKLEQNIEKSIRQCLRQQELLKTVWHKVLSYEIYNQTLGRVMNSFCDFLINSLIGVEDISSSASEQLVDTFKVVATRGPKLFSDPKEINLYVSNWYRFNELIFVLSSNLIEINDRWADGKGPLALQFKPNELKGLIRALFQNTERRAAVLAKIHD